MPKDPYGYNQEIDYAGSSLTWIRENEDMIRKFIKDRPSVTRSYEDLVKAVESNELTFNPVSPDEWEDYARDVGGFEFEKGKAPGGFYMPQETSVNFPTTEYGKSIIPHELMHYFASHKAGRYGTPETINPYIQADMFLGGWLPSFHPAGRAPTIPKWMDIGIFSDKIKNWNENIATKQTKYSNKRGYHPWFDEQVFDKFHETPFELAMKNTLPSNNTLPGADKPVGMKNNYPIYKKESKTAESFREAFARHRAAGDKTFTWADAEGVARKYNTKVRGE